MSDNLCLPREPLQCLRDMSETHSRPPRVTAAFTASTSTLLHPQLQLNHPQRSSNSNCSFNDYSRLLVATRTTRPLTFHSIIANLRTSNCLPITRITKFKPASSLFPKITANISTKINHKIHNI